MQNGRRLPWQHHISQLYAVYSGYMGKTENWGNFVASKMAVR